MTAYDVSEWSDLFVATAGAAAALAGLVFVAVSINIENILKGPGLPDRALETVVTLLAVVVISIACLIPEQSITALGIELVAITSLYGIQATRLISRSLPHGPQTAGWRVSRIALVALVLIPLLVGSLSLLAEAGGGLYWIVAGIAAAICAAVANAWVLLVEILR